MARRWREAGVGCARWPLELIFGGATSGIVCAVWAMLRPELATKLTSDNDRDSCVVVARGLLRGLLNFKARPTGTLSFATTPGRR